MSEFLQQIPLVAGPASIMVAVYWWHRRPMMARDVNRASMFRVIA